MGGRITREIEAKQKEYAITTRLMDMKQKKLERDIQVSTQIAMSRDRVNWMLAFYVTMMSVGAVRAWRLRTLALLPLEMVPPVLVPFVAGYQADLAYGTKANRVAAEAARIRANEPQHYFNEPMLLPRQLQQPYQRLQASTNQQRALLGLPPERDWARFE